MSSFISVEAFKQNPFGTVLLTLLTVNPISTACFIAVATTAMIRAIMMLPYFNPKKPVQRASGEKTRIMIMLGSGGHTAEMLLLLRGMDRSLYARRSYIITTGDDFSEQKALEFEDELEIAAGGTGKPELLPDGTTKNKTRGFDIFTIPRPRKIHEAAPTAVLNSLRCFGVCLSTLQGNGNPALRKAYGRDPQYPAVIVCNGPGVCVCMVLAVLWLRFWDWRGKRRSVMRTIYVESVARVKSLSLSGRILRYLVDVFVVQWPELAQKVGGEYHGRLALDAALNLAE